jgi:hypothetical protein
MELFQIFEKLWIMIGPFMGVVVGLYFTSRWRKKDKKEAQDPVRSPSWQTVSNVD